ncbi:MAG: hypothetical protein DI566_04375 [Microbacterium sp.]|nr:MAG: hypothetical protein DI566_04375 [Microbacterium sp.]
MDGNSSAKDRVRGALPAPIGVAVEWMRQRPVSIGFALVAIIGAIFAATPLGSAVPLAVGVPQLLGAQAPWTVITALLVPSSPLAALVVVALSLTLLAAAEATIGSLRTLVALIGLSAVSLVAAVVAHAALWTVAGLRPFEAPPAPVQDPVIAIACAVMFASAAAPALWRRRVRLVGLGILAMFALYAGDADSWYRLTAAGIGLAAGGLLLRSGETHAWHRSSIRETRSLLAMIVAVVAVGPFTALLADGGRGPLARVSDLFDQVDQHLVDACARHYFAECDQVSVAVITRGTGPALLALVPLALLLVAAWGLRSGRRAGWLLALIVLAGIAVESLIGMLSGRDAREYGDALDVTLAVLGDLILPAALAVALLLSKRAFSVRADRRTAISAAVTVGVAAVLAIGAYATIAVAFPRDFDHPLGPASEWGDALLTAIRRLLPTGMGVDPHVLAYPERGPALLAYQWVGVAFWFVVIVMLLRVLRSRRKLPDSDGTLFRALLRRGGSSVSWWGTWEGNRYWYSDDLQSAVAYRLVGDVALAIGGPVGDAVGDAAPQAIDGFVAMCAVRNWTPAFYSVEDELLPAFDERGWEHLPVAEETVLDLATFDLAGKAWQKVRQPLTRAEREGMQALWTTWAELPAGVTAQIVELSEAWVSEKALPEMRFTLGSLAEASDPDVAVTVAIDAAGVVQAVTSWMPVWRDGVLVGRTLDFMRRRPDGPNGVMEYVIARTALICREAGMEFVSLSGAPLAIRDTAGEGAESALGLFLAWLASALEPVYGFASLFRFKAKFRPRYVGVHLAYADPLALPRIGVAIARAYLPDARPRDVLAVARGGRTRPAPSGGARVEASAGAESAQGSTER